MRRLVVRAWLALALAACTDDDGAGDRRPDGADTDGSNSDTDRSVDDPCDPPISAVIGTGANAYEPLVDGSLVTMVHGPQGGWHVETSAIVTASAQEVSVIPRIVAPDLGGLQIAGDQQAQYIALAAYDAATCTGEFWGVRAFIDEPDPPPDGMNVQQFICSLEGQTLELTVAVTDLSAQEVAESTVSVMAALDPSDVLPCANL